MNGIRWRCPHCLGGLMRLGSAYRHVIVRHPDCAACRVERLMLAAAMHGRGFVFWSDR